MDKARRPNLTASCEGQAVGRAWSSSEQDGILWTVSRRATTPAAQPVQLSGPRFQTPSPGTCPRALAGCALGSHLVAARRLLQRHRGVAPMFGGGVADPAQCLLVHLAEQGQLLSMLHAQAHAHRRRAETQVPHALHQARQLPVGPKALESKGSPALRTGVAAALRAVRLLTELGDAPEAEAMAAGHADRVLQEIQAHGAPGLLAQPLPRGPRGHGRLDVVWPR